MAGLSGYDACFGMLVYVMLTVFGGCQQHSNNTVLTLQQHMATLLLCEMLFYMYFKTVLIVFHPGTLKQL